MTNGGYFKCFVVKNRKIIIFGNEGEAKIYLRFDRVNRKYSRKITLFLLYFYISITLMEVRYISLFSGIDMSERRLPVFIKRASKPGPIVWLTAAAHGDEFTGVTVIHRIFNFLNKRPLQKGILYALPMMNILGLELVKRENPYDNQDINRSFPGDPKGDTTERLAAAVFNHIVETKPSLVIDIHSDTLNSLPYAIVDRPLSEEPRVKEIIEKSWRFAEKFGLTVAYEIKISGYKKYQLDKSLAAALVNRVRIPAFTAELGGPNVLNETFIRMGTRGIKNILRVLGMIEAWEPLWVSDTKIQTKGKLELVGDITTSKSGFIEYFIKIGQFLRKGKPIARIVNVFGKTEEVIQAEKDCHVILLSDRVTSFPGSSIVTVAVEKGKAKK